MTESAAFHILRKIASLQLLIVPKAFVTCRVIDSALVPAHVIVAASGSVLVLVETV